MQTSNIRRTVLVTGVFVLNGDDIYFVLIESYTHNLNCFTPFSWCDVKSVIYVMIIHRTGVETWRLIN